MSKLEKIKVATKALTPEEKQKLRLFLAVRLPTPRKISKRQMVAWICKDDLNMAHFRLGE